MRFSQYPFLRSGSKPLLSAVHKEYSVLKSKCASLKKQTCMDKNKNHPNGWFFLVEHSGVEPLTSSMRTRRTTNCANAPRRLCLPIIALSGQ